MNGVRAWAAGPQPQQGGVLTLQRRAALGQRQDGDSRGCGVGGECEGDGGPGVPRGVQRAQQEGVGAVRQIRVVPADRRARAANLGIVIAES